MTFELQPTLTGDRLELRPLEPSDFDALFGVAADPLIWEQHPARTRYQEPVFRQLFEQSLQSGGALVAIDRESGAVIGSSRYHGYNEPAAEIEIGWSFLARAYWGGAYNGEMKRLMLEHAFQFVESVIFLIGPNNIRSQKAIARIGAQRDGSRHDASGMESWLYRIRRTDFATS